MAQLTLLVNIITHTTFSQSKMSVFSCSFEAYIFQHE